MSHYRNESGTVHVYATEYPESARSRKCMVEIYENGRLVDRVWYKSRRHAEENLRRRGIL